MASEKTKEDIHLVFQFAFYTVAAFMILYIAASFTAQDGNRITGMAASGSGSAEPPSEDEICKDGTLLYECSPFNTGNMCVPTKNGPSLRFSEKCYE